MLLVNHLDVQFEIKTGDRIAQLIIKKISLDKLNKENNLGETKQGDQGFGSTDVTETPKILILKNPKINQRRLLSPPMGSFLKRWISSLATRNNWQKPLSHLV